MNGQLPANGQVKTILLVEDDPNDIELIKRAFKKKNIVNKLIVATDGVEALDYLFREGKYQDRSLDDDPQVVLLDLKLPKLDGLAVLKRLRANQRTALYPVVILTSSREERDLVEGYKLGANSYVQKPIDFEQFAEAVSSLGLYWLLMNISPPCPDH